MNNITILINSSDGFEDCWNPFFRLFSKFWPNCQCDIVLNTEKKYYSYEGLKIKSSQVNFIITDRKLTWSECLILCLENIDNPLVLYMQEDYFIDKFVNIEIIKEFVELMLLNKDISYIGLTCSGNYPPFLPSEIDKRLLRVGSDSKYRISTQAGIWRKEILQSYLLTHENGWMFEYFGTLRSHKRKELFLTVDRNLFSKDPIISYLLTGIIKSQWHAKIPILFKANDIKIDYHLRGFYVEKSLFVRKFETAKKLLMNPFAIFKSLFS